MYVHRIPMQYEFIEILVFVKTMIVVTILVAGK